MEKGAKIRVRTGCGSFSGDEGIVTWCDRSTAYVEFDKGYREEFPIYKLESI